MTLTLTDAERAALEAYFAQGATEGPVRDDGTLVMDVRSSHLLAFRYGIGQPNGPMTHEEIARITGFTPATVKNYLTRARAKLRHLAGAEQAIA